jgi:DNA-binding PadR family transcriptional regulator
MRNRTFGHHFGPWMAPFPGHFAFDFEPRGRGARGGRGGRGRGRRNRGDVRAALLALLSERPMHGYEMIQELDERTGGIWRPSPGSVYPTLQLLEDEGLITSETSEGRKRFTLTDAGREEAARATEAPPWAQFADDDTLSTVSEFRKASFGVMNAVGQVGFSGSDEQRARALEVLAETRRKLYAILAEDDAE